MDAIEAIHTRRSAGKLTAEPVLRDQIEALLDAGAQAPNHYKVRPWRFIVLTGRARERLGEVMAEIFQRRFPDVQPEAVAKERAKPLRAPLIIAVGVDEPTEPKVLEIENICAVAAACENILLAAHAMGLDGHWRTGDAAREPEIKTFLGLSDKQRLLAFLYIGYVEGELGTTVRPSFEDRTTWME